MNVGAAIYARLNASTAAGSRIYPLMLPQNPTYPAVTFQQISAIATHAMGQDGPITRIRMQVNSWGSTYATARSLAGEVEALLKRFRGTAAGIVILDVLLDNELETFESDTQTRRVVQDYSVFVSN